VSFGLSVRAKLTALHLYWPPTQFDRLGLHGVRSYTDPDPEVTKVLTRELSERLSSAFDPESVRIRLEPHMGSIGDRIAMLAEEDRADLVVVGSHERDAVGRILSGFDLARRPSSRTRCGRVRAFGRSPPNRR